MLQRLICTEVDLHIVTGPDIFGGLVRILISQCAYLNIWILLAHPISYLVHKVQQNPHV